MISEQEVQYHQSVGREFDVAIDAIFLSNADRVGPVARKKLSGLLKYYARQPHPFTKCVRDNRKRFGPRAENVCAVLKDIIRGTTKWRGKNNPLDKGTAGLSDQIQESLCLADLYDAGVDLDELGNPMIDQDLFDLITNLSEDEIVKLTGLAAKEESDD